LLAVLLPGLLRYRLKQNPGYTVQHVNNLVRSAWVEEIMRRRDGILAVQTLRNSMMAAVFLLPLRCCDHRLLSCRNRATKLRTTWQALDVFGAASSRLWLSKMLLLLIDLLFAFFSFAMAYACSITSLHDQCAPERKLVAASPAHVGALSTRRPLLQHRHARLLLHRALLLWLFGPHFMLAGTVALVAHCISSTAHRAFRRRIVTPACSPSNVPLSLAARQSPERHEFAHVRTRCVLDCAGLAPSRPAPTRTG